MGRRIVLAAILTLLSGMAFAGHALEPETTPVAKEDKSVEPGNAAAPATEMTAKPAPQLTSPNPATIVVPAPKVEVKMPSELDVYMVPAATREVCTTRDWGAGEIETDCRVRPVPITRANPQLRGLCVTRYGQRVCY